MARQANRAGEHAGEAELLHTLRVAAQQIWLAGLNALVRTQEEGGKVFGALKQEGRRTGRAVARNATTTLDRFEQLFEAGIGRTLERLGVPTAKEMRAITERLDALEGRRRGVTARGGAASGVRQTARKTGIKRATRSPAKRRTRTPA